jgi:hypothetical protein
MAAEVPHYEVFWNLNSHGLADFAEESGLRTYPISPEIVYLSTGLDGPLSDPNCVGGNQGMSEHNLIPLWFSPQQREELGPYIQQLVEHKTGGVLLISVDVHPTTRNHPRVAFAVFDARERAALRKQLLKCKRDREAEQSRQKAQGDVLSAETTGGDSGETE